MRVAVLGASGAVGRAIVRDLQASEEISGVTQLDKERSRAAGSDVSAVDAQDRQQLTLALEGIDLLVNAAGHEQNLAAMDAAVAAGCHHLDLGGLVHVAREQFALHPAVEQAGLVALPGHGAGPGITNLLAVWAAEGLDAIHAIRCAGAIHDEEPPPGLSLPTPLHTLLEELNGAPIVMRDGELVELRAFSDGGEMTFPDPVGPRATLQALRCEVLTLGASLGASEVDVRLGLSARATTSLRQISQGAPAPPVTAPSDRTWSAQLAEVDGERDGVRVTVRATAVTPPHEEWGLGGDLVAQAALPGAVARLMARGELLDPTGYAPLTGVHPPERALRPDVLWAEIARRGTVVAKG